MLTKLQYLYEELVIRKSVLLYLPTVQVPPEQHAGHPLAGVCPTLPSIPNISLQNNAFVRLVAYRQTFVSNHQPDLS